MTLKLAPVNHRWQIGVLMNERKLLGHAVEVGTHRGEFAESFRRVWEGRCLFCIDPWVNPLGYEEQAKLLTGGGSDRLADLREAERRLLSWLRDGSVRFVRDVSPRAARRFKDASLDFVYLDGDHEVAAVAADLAAWWPKVKPGGLIGGHDFVCPGEGDGSPGGWGGRIQPAVLEFAARHSLDIRLVPEFGKDTAGDPWSFYVEKK